MTPAGFVVMRYLASSAAKDVRRHRLFEKALDALATSPYARYVEQWVLAGGTAIPLSFSEGHCRLIFSGNLCTWRGRNAS